MSRDSEAPRDEAQPLTKEERENALILAEMDPEGDFSADIIIGYEATVQRLEAENAALWDVLNEDGWDCSADPGHEHLAAKLEALRAKRLTS